MSDDVFLSSLPCRAPVAVWRDLDQGLGISSDGYPIFIRVGDSRPIHEAPGVIHWLASVLEDWDNAMSGDLEVLSSGRGDGVVAFLPTTGSTLSICNVNSFPRRARDSGKEIVRERGTVRALYSVVKAKGYSFGPSKNIKIGAADFWQRIDPSVKLRSYRDEGMVFYPEGFDPARIPTSWHPAEPMIIDPVGRPSDLEQVVASPGLKPSVAEFQSEAASVFRKPEEALRTIVSNPDRWKDGVVDLSDIGPTKRAWYQFRQPRNEALERVIIKLAQDATETAFMKWALNGIVEELRRDTASWRSRLDKAFPRSEQH